MTARPDSTFPIRFKPYKLDISQFGETPRTEMNFSIENIASFDVHLSMVQFPEELVIVELPDVVEAGKTAQGTLRLKDTAIDKVFDKSFTVELDDEPHSRFTIPIIRKLHNPPPSHTTTAADKSGEGSSKR